MTVDTGLAPREDGPQAQLYAVEQDGLRAVFLCDGVVVATAWWEHGEVLVEGAFWTVYE